MSKQKNNSEWVQEDGGWKRNGVFYPRVAKIRADKLLKNPELRNYFKPNTFVHYCTAFIFKEEVGAEQFIYFASVKRVEGDDTDCRLIPLGLLEFTSEQKKEIIKKTRFPKKAFDKIPVGIKGEESFDEPFGVSLDGLD